MRQLKLQRTKKVVNVKEENEIRTLQIKRACKRYEDIMDECPDEYVNKISRQISFLYYFAKYMNSNKRMIRENLEKIDFNPFVNIYMTSNINELYDKFEKYSPQTTFYFTLLWSSEDLIDGIDIH